MHVRRYKVCTLWFTIVFVTACSAASPQPPSVVPSSLPQITRPALSPSSVVPSPSITSPNILPTPAASVPLDTLRLATIKIRNPDVITVLNGFVWVKTDDGRVVQVDPSTNQVIGELKVDTAQDVSRYCQSFGSDGTNLWACSAGNETIDVVRIDPGERKIVTTVKVATIFDQFHMPFFSNRIWVLSGNADKLVGIDVTTNQPGQAIELGVSCFQLAATDDALVATCQRENLILKIDPTTGQITGRMMLDEPEMIAAAGDAIWVGTKSGVVRLAGSDLRLIATFSGIVLGSAGDISATKEVVWVRQQGGFLYELDAQTNTIRRQIVADPNLSGGSVSFSKDSVWTTAADDNVLIRLKR